MQVEAFTNLVRVTRENSSRHGLRFAMPAFRRVRAPRSTRPADDSAAREVSRERRLGSRAGASRQPSVSPTRRVSCASPREGLVRRTVGVASGRGPAAARSVPDLDTSACRAHHQVVTSTHIGPPPRPRDDGRGRRRPVVSPNPLYSAGCAAEAERTRNEVCAGPGVRAKTPRSRGSSTRSWCRPRSSRSPDGPGRALGRAAFASAARR